MPEELRRAYREGDFGAGLKLTTVATAFSRGGETPTTVADATKPRRL